MIPLLIILLVLLVTACRFFINARRPTHAGGVVYKMEGDCKVYLLVTAKNNTQRWVLPKGHIENREKEEDTAVREVVEEAGVKGLPERKLGNVMQIKNFIHPINTAFYLLRYNGEVSSQENRLCKWLAIDEAIDKASNAAHKKILKQLK